MKKSSLMIILGIILFGCDADPIKLKPGETCNDEYKDKVVEISGELYVPSEFITVSGGAMHMYIKGEGTEKTPIIAFWSGNEANRMEPLPENYTEEDVKIHDMNNQIIKSGDRVRVVGKMVSTLKSWCQLDVKEIEK